MYKDDILIEDMLSNLSVDKNAVIIDVRTPAEWENTGIASVEGVETHKITIVNLPEQEIQETYEVELNASVDKDKTVYCICRSGKRSQIAASIASKNGYENSYNVIGGMNEWISQEQPIKK